LRNEFGGEEDKTHFTDLLGRLTRYCRGETVSFENVPLDVEGTPFQQAVWQATRAIPRGQTRTYGQIAREVGSPGAARAVGAAEGANPVPIIVPCHRVVGANGALCGFGGGLPLKAQLLALERGSQLCLEV
jgi:methylated-DNA-[protein]-cysteine S-methyltransferase